MEIDKDMKDTSNKGLIISRVIVSILLFWALDKHPYDYYTILRWIVCGISLYSAHLSYNMKKMEWIYIFGGIAILFNPIIPVHFTQPTWKLIDFVTGLVFLISIYFIKGTAPKKETIRKVAKIVVLIVIVMGAVIIAGKLYLIHLERQKAEKEKIWMAIYSVKSQHIDGRAINLSHLPDGAKRRLKELENKLQGFVNEEDGVNWREYTEVVIDNAKGFVNVLGWQAIKMEENKYQVTFKYEDSIGLHGIFFKSDIKSELVKLINIDSILIDSSNSSFSP